MFLINIKQYIRTPAILFVTICYFLYLTYLIATMPHVDVAYPFMIFMNQIKITFFFFLFISYEYISKTKRCRLEEVVNICGKRGLIAKLSGIFLFVLLDILICIVLFLSVYYAALKQEIIEMNFFCFLVKCTFIHHFLVYFLAILLGFSVSYIKSRTIGYGVLMLICCIMGRSIIVPLISLSFGREWLYRIADLLSIITRDFLALPNLYYMFSVEGIDVQRVLFWIFLTVAIVCIAKNRDKWKWMGIVSGVMMIFCLILFFQPTSAAYVDVVSGLDSWTADDAYYGYLGANDCNDENQYKEPDFKVIKYKISLEVERELTAVAEVYVDRNDLKEYQFTLYHGYTVKTVTNEKGDDLTFYQDGDFLRVLTENNLDEKIILKYKGHCKRYYSTSQGMFLPAYFEYYPIPGWRQVYMNEYYYTGNTKEGLGYEADFDLTVHSREKVYSNLEKTSSNRMCGRTDGVTLISSPFAKEMEIENCRIIYSSIEFSGRSLREQKKLWGQFIHKYVGKNCKKTIIIPPVINGSFDYFGSDHLMGDISMLSSSYETYINTGERYPYITEEELMDELEQIK